MGPYGTDLSSGSAYVDDTQEPSIEVDHDDRCATPFSVFRGQRIGCLGGQGRGIEARDLAERGDDVVQHAADPDGRVRQVDDDVPGGVQGCGRGPDGDGFPGTDLAGDHAEGVLVHAPGDPRDGFTMSRVAVQHARCEVASEWHLGESVVRLQALNGHPVASSRTSSGVSLLGMSSMLSCPGSCPSGRG